MDARGGILRIMVKGHQGFHQGVSLEGEGYAWMRLEGDHNVSSDSLLLEDGRLWLEGP